ncbi:multicopper oxidase domain-containing protein [Hoyosella sp. G463]|uniref:Multicopper oxidase domain-containing protein n=1 Tax=Lolliginicoccus lacisalsi TaxID=2742202 RepID=A0A927JDY5_9ACTN|nr:multicopper oxidase domain-containing protein [Lolliginicoccus lacisalsi]MBD8507578.1 multicopper oxidase domain-containing protein [Lolliginicoccus lacisalsi]
MGSRVLPSRLAIVARLALIVILAGIAAMAIVMAMAWSSAVTDTSGAVALDTELRIPPLAGSRIGPDGARVFDLEMRAGTADLGHGPQTRTWGVNGDYLGPTIRAARGDTVRINVDNELGETSTLHWHGMHLPAAMDGGPHQLIETGQRWAPEWTIAQPAATLWYHPHLHGATAEHVYRGIAGMFIVDEPGGPDLPSEYGVDDIPVIVQDKQFRDGQLDMSPALFAEAGVLGGDVLVNGTPAPYLEVTTERVRLRLLNASSARSYRFVVAGTATVDLIGTDGGLLERPHRVDHVQLSPGERAEIIVEVAAGTTAVLRSEPPELGLNFWTDRFSGGDDTLEILGLRAVDNLAPSPGPPPVLAAPRDLGEPATRRELTITSSSTINGRTMDMERIDETVTVGTTEIWEVRNATGDPHNFHIHDVQFQILDPEGPLQSGPKDTVYIRPGQVVRLLVRFEHYTDPATPYMFHCHLLAHEDRGLMGQFVVVEPGATATESSREHPMRNGARAGP